jgi:spore germination cell wall hydrolase CwlJ-like protein
MITHMWDRLALKWRALDRGDIALAGALALFLAVLGGIGRFAYTDHAEEPTAAQRVVDLACLAENVYYEARGEPLAGQYAVAEVTMNRVRSRLFPNTVCEVVHAARWDAGRERHVGAFSWTVLERDRPYGFEWRRAQAVASTVYDNHTEAPLVDGALFYHATRVSPAWAAGKTRIARIGQHLFYE